MIESAVEFARYHIQEESEETKMSLLIVLIFASLGALVGGLTANPGMMAGSALLFGFGAFISYKQSKIKWPYTLSVDLILFGVFGGFSWPILREILPWIGIAVGVIHYFRLIKFDKKEGG